MAISLETARAACDAAEADFDMACTGLKHAQVGYRRRKTSRNFRALLEMEKVHKAATEIFRAAQDELARAAVRTIAAKAEKPAKPIQTSLAF